MLVTGCVAALVFASVAYAAVGDLTQKPAPAGCIGGWLEPTGTCQDGGPLNRPHDVAVSPDGASVYVASLGGLDPGAGGVTIFDRDPTGALTNKASGCVSEGSSYCQGGLGFSYAFGVAVSPDGASVYVVSSRGGEPPGSVAAMAIFDRNPTGALTQKPGTAGCVSETGTGGACQDGVAVDNAFDVAVSPDGTSVYVASYGAVAIFDRDPTGALTQKPGTAGCVSETGTGGACQDGVGLDGAADIAVSPDGASVYVASGNAVAIFDRNTSTGALTQKPGTAGCVSETGTGGACQDGVALDGARGVAVSPDGTSVYVASGFSSHAVAIFDRNASTGALAQKPGTAGCVSETGDGGTCQQGVALGNAEDLAVSPDGASLYVVSYGGAEQDVDAVAVFDRDPTTGALTQKPGTGGCVSQTGTGGACQDGVALQLPSGVAVSPDGASVYVASYASIAVAIFDRQLASEPPPPPPPDTAGGGAPGDATPPDTQITKGPKAKTKKKSATFEFSSTEPGSTFECKLDSGSFAPCTSPEAYRAKKGKHGFSVRANDAAGNVDPTPATQSWKVKKKK